MAEYKLFDGGVPYVSTLGYHRDRARAPHLEQPAHRARLERAASFVREATARPDCWTVSDLGCGDGGLLSLIEQPEIISWGYDFTPANQAGWAERGVTAYAWDVFQDLNAAVIGDVVVMTEVLEHLAEPHRVLGHLRERAKRLVCSSPWIENDLMHDLSHAWAWDMAGYRQMITAAGWSVQRHEQVGIFQVVLAE